MRGMGTPRIIDTYLIFGDDPELSGSPCLAGQSSIGNFSGSTDGGTGRYPVANLTRDYFDQAHPGIVLGAVMLPVFEVAEERRDPDQTVSGGGQEVAWSIKRTNIGDQNFSMSPLSWETFAIPDTLAHPVVFWS